jgi:serine/threonine-protein kinase RsbW
VDQTREGSRVEDLVEFACAGHAPPLILSSGVPAAFAWDGRSAPLGLPPCEGARPQAELQLPPTATVLLYTDGLIEIRREPIDQGLARLADEVERVRDLRTQHLIDTVTTRILTGHSTHDDICALCVQSKVGRFAPARRHRPIDRVASGTSSGTRRDSGNVI